MKILVATEKPFAAVVSKQIKKILESEDCQVEFLEKYTSKAELISALDSVEGLIVRSDLIDQEVLDNAPKLHLIVRAGSGYDTIDVAYARSKGILVANTPGQNANAVAELLFAMILYVSRNRFDGSIGEELRTKSIGLHAFGYVGQAVARIAKGFGMDVYVYDPFLSPERMAQMDVIACETLEELYATCDVISIHVPLTTCTKGIVNKELFSLLKPTAILANTARKEVVQEDDLKQWLASSVKARYIADVKPSNGAELEQNFYSQVFFTTKKQGAQTMQANANAGVKAAEQIKNFFQDPALLKHEVKV